MKILELKNYILGRKQQDYPGGNTLCRRMPSLFEAGCNGPAITLTMDGHMF